MNINMSDHMVRRPEQGSPRTSPRAQPSPVVVPRQDSSGTLKTTILLGKTPAIVHSGPFYLMKEAPAPSETTGATNLIVAYSLQHSFNKFCGRKVKDSLSSFLPNLPGNIDSPVNPGESSLRKLIENPPITSIEIMPLQKQQLDSAFRLHVGPIPEQYRYMNQSNLKKKNKKKSKQRLGDDPLSGDANDSNDQLPSMRDHEKKHKKQKRYDDEKERRKKKKDKKKKKQRHSPDPQLMSEGPMSHGSVSSPMPGGPSGTTSSLTSLLNPGMNSLLGNDRSSSSIQMNGRPI